MAANRRQAQEFIKKVLPLARERNPQLTIHCVWVPRSGKGDHGKVEWTVNSIKIKQDFVATGSSKFPEVQHCRKVLRLYLARLELSNNH